MEEKLIIVFLIASMVFLIIGLVQVRREEKKSVVSATRFSYMFLWQAFDNWGDFVFYPFVIGLLGAFYGFVAMFFITLVLNTVYVYLNNNTEEDWTFLGSFTRLRDNDSSVWLLPYARFIKACRLWKIRKCYCFGLNVLRKILRKRIFGVNVSKPIGFLFFSIKFDSFCAIAYLYHKKVNLRDTKILSLYLLSHAICNLVWVPVALGISKAVEWIVNFFNF